MPDDLTKDGLDGAGESSNSDKGKSPNWEKKYKGMSSKYEDLRLKFERLQQEQDDAMGHHEEEMTTSRLEAKNALKKAQDFEKQAADTEKIRLQLEKELTGFKSKAETATKVAAEYPALLDMLNSGDLREPQDFSDPKDYQAYLERMNKRVSSDKAADDKKTRTAGATPTTATRAKDGAEAQTLDELTDELESLNPNKPEDSRRYEQIIREMDKYTSRR